MNKKKTPKDYDYYTMKIPNKLRILFDKYIKMNDLLGFKNVSQYALYILQQEAVRILNENPNLKEEGDTFKFDFDGKGVKKLKLK